MGSFSWLKADKLTDIKNIVYGTPYKFLIPQEFGGGFIADSYQDCGYLGTKEDGSYKYDMCELLAFWNRELLPQGGLELHYTAEKFPLMKEVDEYTQVNRSLGIDIGCYRDEIAKLKYPLKLVSESYEGTYEDLDGRSYIDPNQGLSALYREEM